MTRRTREMLGEFLRDAAVLVLVFAPLDALLAGRLTVSIIAGTVVFSGGFLTCGIYLDPGRASSIR